MDLPRAPEAMAQRTLESTRALDRCKKRSLQIALSRVIAPCPLQSGCRCSMLRETLPDAVMKWSSIVLVDIMALHRKSEGNEDRHKGVRLGLASIRRSTPPAWDPQT